MANKKLIAEAKDEKGVSNKYRILYWGITHQLVGMDNIYPGHYTVVFCENLLTHNVEQLLPIDLKIIGEEV